MLVLFESLASTGQAIKNHVIRNKDAYTLGTGTALGIGGLYYLMNPKFHNHVVAQPQTTPVTQPAPQNVDIHGDKMKIAQDAGVLPKTSPTPPSPSPASNPDSNGSVHGDSLLIAKQGNVTPVDGASLSPSAASLFNDEKPGIGSNMSFFNPGSLKPTDDMTPVD